MLTYEPPPDNENKNKTLNKQKPEKQSGEEWSNILPLGVGVGGEMYVPLCTHVHEQGPSCMYRQPLQRYTRNR